MVVYVFDLMICRVVYYDAACCLMKWLLAYNRAHGDEWMKHLMEQLKVARTRLILDAFHCKKVGFCWIVSNKCGMHSFA